MADFHDPRSGGDPQRPAPGHGEHGSAGERSGGGSWQLDATVCIARRAQPRAGHAPAGEGTRRCLRQASKQLVRKLN